MAITLPTGWLNYFSGCQPAQGASCPIDPFAGDPITAGPIDSVGPMDPQLPNSFRFFSADDEHFSIQSRYNGFECCGYQAVPLAQLPDAFFACVNAPGFPISCVPGTVTVEVAVNIVLDQVSNGQSGIFLGRSTDSPNCPPPCGFPGIGSTSDFHTVLSLEYDEQQALTSPIAGLVTHIYGLSGTETICDSFNGQAVADCVRNGFNGLQPGNLIEIANTVYFVPGNNPYSYTYIELRPDNTTGNFSVDNPYGTPCSQQAELRIYIQSGSLPSGFTEDDMPNRAGIFTSGSVDGDANRIGYWKQFAAWKRRSILT